MNISEMSKSNQFTSAYESNEEKKSLDRVFLMAVLNEEEVDG